MNTMILSLILWSYLTALYTMYEEKEFKAYTHKICSVGFNYS